ncbi:MAG: nucleotidyltransferase family protein [Roseiflexus sp.]|jgi:molybdenum cofactor cytidylyltransferase|uniref:nucleotidyltransferase family protein n=1 Tax=Roseiflexus sp. TaxID=2562120 RepID=UPI0025E29A94|nr:nucleotidyltransferase family protein [Roseiflexus sp.]MCL6542486.1 nucleotidyltransferase family protein [Roseiflexus sp.]
MIAGIMLAAGSSSRMGQPKQLLDWGGRPLVRVIAATALAAALDEVIVVTADADAAVAAALADLPIRIVPNPRAAEGQSTSLCAGIAALSAGVEAALILLGDQPFVTAAIINALIDAWRDRRVPVVAPVFAGVRGNPVLFDRAMFGELLTIEGDQGARGVIARDPTRVHLIHFDDERPLLDIDTPEAYTRARRLLDV